MGREPSAVPLARLLRDRQLLAVLGVAAALRLGVAAWPVIHHADEVWQYLEPAWHLAVGPWVRTWEARAGARSWLLPMLFAGPLALGQAVAPGTVLPIMLARLVCVALSLGTVIGAAALGARISRRHGLIAALVAATWFEIVYFAPRTLSEPIATACFVAAAAVLADKPDARWMATGGALLGAVCVVRFHYAPAAAILAAAAARLEGRRWTWLALGGGGMLGVSAVADAAAGAWPFLWVVRNVTLNLVANRSAGFGVGPPWQYPVDLFALWGWAIVPITALAVAGARRYPALFAAAAVDLAVHAAVPHKEYRFILLTTTLLVLLAGIGSVDLAMRLRERRRHLHLGALGTAWVALSLACGATGSSTRDWGQNAALLGGWRLAGGQHRACGIAAYRPRDPVVASYALFGRGAPIYQYDDRTSGSARRSHAFDLVLTSPDHAVELPDYTLVGCPRGPGDFCLYRRPGQCHATQADRPDEVNAVLARYGL